MEEPSTAQPLILQYYNRLINMRLLSQVVVSDKQGKTILCCFGEPQPSRSDADSELSGGGGNDGEEDMPIESNVVLSGVSTFQMLDQLHLGAPKYISAQYRDTVVVQTMDDTVMLTLIGHRSQGHFVGGLLALLPQMKSNRAYEDLINQVKACFAY
ncbi:hypothetical protein STCU_01898 [Strigomonas culicis]|uniref:Uncharacterized protein n=1 Tax=Strigomonas culicis TaxID=28005 RepID=S9UDQ6_9TRYP|nr:hypothetical protein STCU_06035 [Strigomonas culicis]EPY33868.1 hypothetical protein STCU_01898 [Strigomonas culicis]|eukprot:EPY26874.1 hypothetical protein STCU_06035 [Strigomonas culicis]